MRARGLIALVLLATACQSATPSPRPTPTPLASAAPSGSLAPAGADLAISEDLRAAVGAAGIRDHLVQLLAIAQANGGIRAAGTAGYTGSVSYVAQVLDDAGYEVTVDEFTFPFFTETAPLELAVAGGPTFVGGDHLHALIFSASGDVESPVVAVALDEEGRPQGNDGCQRADWADFPAGAVALVGPGGCFTRQKVEEAIAAGAAALVAANPGWPARSVRRPTLLFPDGITIPAVGASAEVGEALLAAAAAGASVHLSVETLIEDRVTANVIAERAGVSPNVAVGGEVVMMGGHLDSVLDGPGINDNGSGTMTILEIALQLAELDPTPRRVRFAFWSAEELGLYGSRAWVEAQPARDLGHIIAYLNLDMVGSPNYGRIVYGPSATDGSGAITGAFGAYFDAVGLTWQAEDLGGGSDHAPFDDADIPTGGLFSGASELKTDDQADLFGGSAGEPMDPCYHLACDRPDQVNDAALDELSDAAAHVLLLLLLDGLATGT